MANTFVFSAPNEHGILYDTAQSQIGAYVNGIPGAEVMSPDNYDEFFQYPTKEECLQKALTLDPSYSKNKIYGMIDLELTASSASEVFSEVGTEIVLFCDFSAPEAGITITYQWFDPQGVAIPTATSNYFSFTPSSVQFAGQYQCIASASGQYNWTGGGSYECNVKLGPKLAF